MKTRGQTTLEHLNIAHTVHWYDHKEKGAAFAATATGIPLQQMIKTLVVADESGKQFAFMLMPGDRELNLKSAAKAMGWRKARMSTIPEAERLTGYQVGGISPFGSRRSLPVCIHVELTQHNAIGINGGARGCIVQMNTKTLVNALCASPHHLTG